MEQPSRKLQGPSIPIFGEGINLVLSRWSALQTAVVNEWGGRDSSRKADQIGIDIFNWFTKSKEPLYIDDLESILDEGMLSLNMEVEDGSVEEVAEKLMIMHEECLEGNFKFIEILREAGKATCPQVKQVVNGDDVSDADEDDAAMDDDEDDATMDDDNSSKMMVDASELVNGLGKEQIPKVPTEAADDGWTVVSNKRNKGKRK